MKQCTLKLFFFISLISLLSSCKSKLNDDPAPFLSVNGGVLDGSLEVPNSNLMIGGELIFEDDGILRFSDGSTQSSAAAGACFGGICSGDTTYTGQAIFTKPPLGSGINNASFLVNPNTVATNQVLFGVSVSGTEKFSLDTEGDLGVSGDLTVNGTLSTGGGFNCTGCINSTSILDLSISNLDLAIDSINSSKIVDGSILGADLADGSINSSKIADNSILSVDLANNSINSSKIADNSILGADIAASSIDSSKITDSSISSTDLANNSINSLKIVDNSILTADLADDSVTISKINEGNNNEVLTTDNLGDVNWLPPQIQYGSQFIYIDASSIQLVPSGINSKASILVSNGTDLRSILISTNLTLDLSTSGIGGLDAGVEAANSGYEVYLIAQAGGASPNLIFTLSGTAPTLPPGYTYISEVLWFVSNSIGGGNSDIMNFKDVGLGECLYLSANGVQVLNDGENILNTAIDLSLAIPSTTAKAKIWLDVENQDLITLTDFNLYSNTLGTFNVDNIKNLLNAVGINNKSIVSKDLSITLSDTPTNSLYYQFTTAPVIGDFGANIYVKGWRISSRMGH